MKQLIIKDAQQLVTCSGFKVKKGKDMSDLGIIDNGAIYIEDDIIKDVGVTEDILKKHLSDKCSVITAKGKCVLPGFIDSHTHLVFGGHRHEEFSMRVLGKSYMEIMEKGGGIISSVNSTLNETQNELINKTLKTLKSMTSFGVTTVEAKSGYGLDLETELKQLEVAKKLNEIQPLSIVNTFMGAHSIPPKYKNGKEDIYVNFIIDKVLPKVKQQNLAEFFDVFVEKNVFTIEQGEKLLTEAKNLGFKLKIHADEICCLGGAELAAKVGAVSADHLLMASDKGLLDMIKKGVVATMLPVTAFSLKENYARARFIIDNGGALNVATDYNPGSCFSENLSLAISIACIYMGMTIEEAITAVTINAAAAINKENEIGSIDIGKKADIIILENESYKFIPYHIGVSCVETVIKNGKVIFNKEV
ncbi:MAG: imidazolonepropionase [Oscillospiraceae bacterium]